MLGFPSLHSLLPQVKKGKLLFPGNLCECTTDSILTDLVMVENSELPAWICLVQFMQVMLTWAQLWETGTCGRDIRDGGNIIMLKIQPLQVVLASSCSNPGCWKSVWAGMLPGEILHIFPVWKEAFCVEVSKFILTQVEFGEGRYSYPPSRFLPPHLKHLNLLFVRVCCYLLITVRINIRNEMTLIFNFLIHAFACMKKVSC